MPVVKKPNGRKTNELKILYEHDQADRRERLFEKNPKLIIKRDKKRLERVLTLIREGKVIIPADHLYAALVLQHGTRIKHYKMAHELAKKAATMKYKPKKGEPDPLWLAAAAKDRMLMTQGKPQFYGTQFKQESKNAPWRLYNVDPKITDEERNRWHVPPLKEVTKKVKKLNKKDGAS